jgi:hypothetical protein
MKYDAWKFEKLAETDFGKQLWDFLNRYDSFIRMETASLMNRPAVEGIVKPLKERFQSELTNYDASQLMRIRQMIGHMTKQIMAKHEYEVKMRNVKVLTGNFFNKGTRYQKITEENNETIKE